MKVYSILILNKAGGLIYQNEIQSGLSKLTANDYLVLAGTLHGVHAIGSELTSSFNTNTNNNNNNNNNSTPFMNNTKSSTEEINSLHNSSILTTGKSLSADSNRSGLKSIETDIFNLYIFQTTSGLKFILITTPNLNDAGKKQTSELFSQLYVAYSDFVMKNPFYSLDMPIKCSLFDERVRSLLLSSSL
ncbi:hypothetical protein PVL30_001619 [Lodderomyces elongisporus]|uniref:uncharacterized protein n=1 Tax=Lodderomyces elongisporus TaxID=36914 RepID=UPI002924B797|nr:uncharacterized protein PVL30_001619 [Lodderomyces elongisporus]WLF77896.1 hypothetical protein PVL30_001619 [Lodderomyces elongisporus]